MDVGGLDQKKFNELLLKAAMESGNIGAMEQAAAALREAGEPMYQPKGMDTASQLARAVGGANKGLAQVGMKQQMDKAATARDIFRDKLFPNNAPVETAMPLSVSNGQVMPGMSAAPAAPAMTPNPAMAGDQPITPDALGTTSDLLRQLSPEEQEKRRRMLEAAYQFAP